MKLKDSVIIILVVVIALGAGVFVGVKLSDNNNNNPIINNENNNGNAETEKDFSLVEAEKMMEKYKIFGCGNLYVTDLKNEDVKTAAAVISLYANETVLCKDIYKNIEQNSGYYEGYYIGGDYDLFCPDGYANVYKYQDVLNAKKNLFGNNSTLVKEDVERVAVNGFGHLDYDADRNAFLTLESGGRGCGCDDNSAIYEAKKIGNDIKVYTKSNSECWVNEKYEYIFKNQNNHYYLAEINKLN